MKNAIAATARLRPELLTRERLVWLLSGLVVVLGLLYAHFLNTAVIAVVDREKTEARVETLRTDLGDLEFAYIEAQESLTLERAKALGFVESDDPAFISRADSGEGLTLKRQTP